jgi:hypothetical protein
VSKRNIPLSALFIGKKFLFAKNGAPSHRSPAPPGLSPKGIIKKHIIQECYVRHLDWHGICFKGHTAPAVQGIRNENQNTSIGEETDGMLPFTPGTDVGKQDQGARQPLP